MLDNAIKYTHQGKIIVSTGPQLHSVIEVSITDTGVGIVAEHLPHTFDRFYRVDPSRATADIGLGLAIAVSVVQTQGGTIEVENKAGQGTADCKPGAPKR